MKDIEFVVDGFFISVECIRSLKTHSKAFTIGIPAYLKIAVGMLKSYSQGVEKYANKLSDKDIYYVDKYFEYYVTTSALDKSKKQNVPLADLSYRCATNQ